MLQLALLSLVFFSVFPRVLGALPSRNEIADDKSRPQYQLMPPSNWMNDPCGPIYFQGVYHMFYQYNPNLPVWGSMSWGHAESRDMIHWRHDPLALWPSTWYDALGVFSGSIAVDGDRKDLVDLGRDSKLIYIYYTAVHSPEDESEVTLKDGVHPWREIQASAVTSPWGGLRDWTKEKAESTMVVDPPFSFEEIAGFRDPAVKFDRQSQEWKMLVGSGKLTEGGNVLVYSSGAANLKDARWAYSGIMLQGIAEEQYIPGTDPVSSDYMWECPDLTEVGQSGLHVLIYGTSDAVFYSLGRLSWHNGTPRFEPISSIGANANEAKRRAKLDHGLYYAARFQDMGERLRGDHSNPGQQKAPVPAPVVWGWIKEPPSRTATELMRAGWAGVMSLPRTIDVAVVPNTRECGQWRGATLLKVSPAAVVETLRDPSPSTEIPTGVNTDFSSLPVLYNLSAEVQLQLAPSAPYGKDSFEIDLSLYPANEYPPRTGSQLRGEEGSALPFVAIRYAYVYLEQEQRFYSELTVGQHSCRVPVVPESCGVDRDGGDANRRSIRVLVDGSVVEVFGGYDCVITARSYRVPSGVDAPLLPTLTCRVGQDKTCGDVVQNYRSWQMKPISNDRLTEIAPFP